MLSFFTPAGQSVNDILAAFDKNISDLEAVRERESAKARQLEDDSVTMAAQARDAHAEASRAQTVTAKLRALIAA